MTVVITRGLPASGKSTWAKTQLASAPPGHLVRVNNDDLGSMMFGGSTHTPGTGKIMETIRESVVDNLLQSMETGAIIVDNTNLAGRTVTRLANLAYRHGAHVVLKDFFDVSPEICKDRNATRENPVPGSVIDRMAKQLPTAYTYTLPTAPPFVERYHNDPSLPHTIIVDVDGTLAIMGNRSPYDWGKVSSDTPNTPVVTMVQHAVRSGTHVLVMSGRDGVSYDDTAQWLDTYVSPGLPLVMRAPHDNRPDHIIKLELFDTHVKDKFHVECVFDDRDQVIHLWRRQLGLPTFQVADGNF